ncbi:GNAT family N-acetyltransferase [Paenibacillus sp. GYB004]|uniref:GNAT family N-acetyltransferase n=1 Tax=Paenibacillus sp. GYB004 TaxID=2994393 RepID=UPI002F96759B
MNDSFDKAWTFYELMWDTKFFGVTSAKVIMHRPLAQNQWDEINGKISNYEFISIENRNSEPANAQLIGKGCSAFLADVNIQFVKKVKESTKFSEDITIESSLTINEKLIELADFPISKFTEDLELAKRGGELVYRQWLINSFERSDKRFAVYWDENGSANGFLLFSTSDNAYVIELVAVSQKVMRKGVGRSLFYAVEYDAYKNGINEIRVGTQVRNLGAINFYHKVGCMQVGCHQVFHLWNY